MATTNLLPVLDCAPHQASIRDDVHTTLAEHPPRISSKYFYDRRGSELFDAICELPEYYPTRTELAIMRRCLEDVAAVIGPAATILEIGSGSGLKTELLLEALDAPACYVPIDISRDHLIDAAERLAERHPELEVAPVCADFNHPPHLGQLVGGSGRRIVYFPGSTLGNLTPTAADALLGSFHRLVAKVDDEEGIPNGLLLGVDLRKDSSILEAAYNDAQGVTAEFNLNILSHLNRRLGCEIPIDGFEHRAPFVEDAQRIEMHLVARRDLTFEIAPHRYHFKQGEWIVTEYSHKYSLADLRPRLQRAGWQVVKTWTDPKNYFALIYCTQL